MVVYKTKQYTVDYVQPYVQYNLYSSYFYPIKEVSHRLPLFFILIIVVVLTLHTLLLQYFAFFVDSFNAKPNPCLDCQVSHQNRMSSLQTALMMSQQVKAGHGAGSCWWLQEILLAVIHFICSTGCLLQTTTITVHLSKYERQIEKYLYIVAPF